MKRFLPIICILLALFITPPASGAFIDDLGDVPLIDGYRIVDDSGFLFEQENGRLVEITIVGDPNNHERVLGFYQKILPNLGWIEISPKLYKRENEELIIELNKKDSASFVTFTLRPIN